MEGCFLPYPAQRNLQRLPLGKLLRAVASVLLHRLRGRKRETAAARPRGVDSDMGSYLHGRFGAYLVKVLMGPLNQKQWAHAPSELTDTWAQHRSGSTTRNVADLDLRRTMKNLLLGEDDLGWTPETRVTYPASGGSGSIWSAVARTIPAEKLMLGTQVISISLEEKTALLSTGETVGWEQIISTMPLDRLLRSVEGRPELAAKADGLVKARSRPVWVWRARGAAGAVCRATLLPGDGCGCAVLAAEFPDDGRGGQWSGGLLLHAVRGKRAG